MNTERRTENPFSVKLHSNVLTYSKVGKRTCNSDPFRAVIFKRANIIYNTHLFINI